MQVDSTCAPTSTGAHGLSPKTPIDLLPHQLHNRYKVSDGELGRGAFGAVHVALDTQTNTKVAIKTQVLPKETQLLRMLLRELRVLRLFPHPHILQSICIAPSLYATTNIRVVTPLYDVNLSQALHAQHLSVSQRQHILVSVCKGLAYLHAAGIVHRDIKVHSHSIAHGMLTAAHEGPLEHARQSRGACRNA
jgi:serine/threonine protein kinase